VIAYPQAWTIDSENAIGWYKDLQDVGVTEKEGDDSDSDAESDSGSGSESEKDDDDEEFADAQEDASAELSPAQQPKKPCHSSQAYTEFLQFLELACSGSPVEGYPMVLIVAAGIPESVGFIRSHTLWIAERAHV
jgi:hypothetical protein